MPGKILVLLRRNERVEEMVSYLRKIARPGMKVVFLIPYPIEPWLWLRDHWVETESPREALLAGIKIRERYSWEGQQALAEHKILPAREALGNKGVEVSVDLFTGGLSNVLRDYQPDEEVQWIMVRQGNGIRVKALLQRARSLLGLGGRPRVSPVLVLRTDSSESLYCAS